MNTPFFPLISVTDILAEKTPAPPVVQNHIPGTQINSPEKLRKIRENVHFTVL